jgi:hypothetical protein
MKGEDLHNFCRSPTVAKGVKSMKLRLAGYVAQSECRILAEKPLGKKWNTKKGIEGGLAQKVELNKCLCSLVTLVMSALWIMLYYQRISS